MANATGIVIRSLPGGKADVVADKQGNCGACSAAHSCHTSDIAKKMTTIVINPLGAEPGDRVAINISTGRLLKGLALIYFPPVLGLLAGAIVGANVTGPMAMSETGSAILFGGIGLILGLGFVVSVSKLLGKSDVFTPVISRIIRKNAIQPIVGAPPGTPLPGCPHAATSQ